MSRKTNNSAGEPITTAILEECLTKLRTDIKSDNANLVNELRLEIKKQQNEINSLREIVIKQAQAIERMETINRNQYGIISGIPENDDDDLLKKTLDAINVTLPENSAKRIGKPDTNKRRLIRVKFNSEEERNNAVTKSRQILSNNRIFKKVYINRDEAPLTRAENARLRQAKKELIKENENHSDSIKISQGKLLMNGVEHDSFNLRNQIF